MSTEEEADNTEEVEAPDAPEPVPPAGEDRPDVKILPPMLLCLFLAAGIVLDWIIPINFGHGWGWLGLLLLGGAFFVAKQAKDLFESAGTNLPPNQPTTAIVTEGPYQYSRNPIYLAFLVGYAGLGMLADAPAMLVLAGGLFFVLEQQVIEPEEKYLAAKFGDEYLKYKESVPRWLGPKASEYMNS